MNPTCHLLFNTTKLHSLKLPKYGGTAPSVCLTGVQRAFAGPFQGADVLLAGHPQGQVVLVIRRDPRRTQYCPDIQAEGEENAHQSHQLQRGQRGHPDLLCAAQRRSHARSKTISFTLKLSLFLAYTIVVHDQHTESGCSSTCHLPLGWRAAARRCASCARWTFADAAAVEADVSGRDRGASPAALEEPQPLPGPSAVA